MCKWADRGGDRSGEPEVAEEVAVLDLLDAGTDASNVGRQYRARPTLDAGKGNVQ